MGDITPANPGWGTGSRLARATVVLAGVTSVVATLISIVSIWLQLKNYRKPLLQRYVVRILIIVPLFAIASYASIVSHTASNLLDPIRDIYEAFTIYTFFQLLINLLDGERSIIIMTYGRPPVQHAWPLNHFCAKVDISDPYTFLAIKRGILQYTWLKPVLSLATIIMKATDTYQEGYLGLSSGYMWCGLIYNVSMTISLYALAMFWVIMHNDLRPYRPVPKFLCVKLIIFASYWQGFFLAILQWLGALPNTVAGYTPDNLAAAIQDSLICFEMPGFALMHWYAFSWTDYVVPNVSAARLPIKYAARDAFGCIDLLQDTKETFSGNYYSYYAFEPMGDRVVAHADSHSRVARVLAGMRYERGGRAKYWIPTPAQRLDARTPLLRGSRRGSAQEVEPWEIDQEDERLFDRARELEFGDWNYPVITANMMSVETGRAAPRRRRTLSNLRKRPDPYTGPPRPNEYLAPHRSSNSVRREKGQSARSSPPSAGASRPSSSSKRREGGRKDAVGSRGTVNARDRQQKRRSAPTAGSEKMGSSVLGTHGQEKSKRHTDLPRPPSSLPPQTLQTTPETPQATNPVGTENAVTTPQVVTASPTAVQPPAEPSDTDEDQHHFTYNFDAVAEERDIWDR